MDNGERYPWVDGVCQCPVCLSGCKKAYKIDNIGMIGIELMRQEASKNEPVIDICEVYKAQGKAFLGNCFKHGANVSNSAVKTLETMNKKGNLFKVVYI